MDHDAIDPPGERPAGVGETGDEQEDTRGARPRVMRTFPATAPASRDGSTGQGRTQIARERLGTMIRIQKSATADTRTCDYANVTKETLLVSSQQHIRDVRAALMFFIGRLDDAMNMHDFDKISDIDGFYRDFVTGFQQTEWWDMHRKVNRHHLNVADGVRDNVNLIDVLDFIADCVMAGMARSGSVYPLQLSPELLERAFQNTVELLKAQVVVEDTSTEPLDAVAKGPA